MLAAFMDVVKYIQQYLFDPGERVERPRAVSLRTTYEQRRDRLQRMMLADRRQRRINFDAKPKSRRAKLLSHWVWECPADLVDIICPEIGEPLVREIYERAEKLRERMKKRRLYKANCYPVDPIVLDKINPREIGIELNIKERFE
jgi:hypothetical protein